MNAHPIPERGAGLRLVAIGDPHLEGSRFASDLPLWDAVIAGVTAARPDLILLMGDLVGGHDTCHVTSLIERAELDPRWRRLSDAAPVHVIRGNHDDVKDLGRLEALRGRHPIVVHQRPGLKAVQTARGPALLYALPYPDKGAILGGRVPASHAEESALITADLEGRLSALGRDLPKYRASMPGVPAILAGHVSISGAIPGGGEIFMPGDGAVSPEAIDAAGADLAVFGHIHQPQELGPRALILGSLRELGHGEGGDGRFWWVFDFGVDATSTRSQSVTRHAVPSGWRPKRTCRATWDGVALTWSEKPSVEGADVRVVVEADEAHEATIPAVSLDGAASVRLERRISRPPRPVRAPALERAASDLERLLSVAPSLTDERGRALGVEVDTGRVVRLGAIIERSDVDPVAEMAATFPGLARAFREV